MKLFKTPTNEIYAYEEDGSQDHLIPEDYVSVTQEKADEIIANNITAETNKNTAEFLLYQTQWVLAEDVADPANPPYLANKDAFIAYRSQLRRIVISPVAGRVNWPAAPTAEWVD
jgi:hypothetical protein